MGEVTISVAGRAYQVICEDGEEDRLSAIAARVDHEAKAFGSATPSLSESRLLLMCSLLLADKLDEAEKAAQTVPPPAVAAIDLASVDDAVKRIEALADGAAAASSLPDNGPADAAPEADETAVEVTAVEETAAEEIQAEPPEAAQPERRPKSSAAMAAEKDLLSWLERPETRESEQTTEVEAEAEAPANAAAPDDAQEAPLEEPPAEGQPDASEAEESEEERAARERAERRARRRQRLARLAKKNNEG